ncbi:MAG: uroporphyrinogen decarboxylase, partial [Gemmatimonadetes bacterium]|nr:uroporphyrinogen decarboxylase [Gemmatimonadota bacterium]
VEQLRAIELIAEGLAGGVPFLATVFTPVGIASRLVPTVDLLASHLREHTALVDGALEAITETFAGFSKAALERGAGGLFYATLGVATLDLLSVAEYRRLVRPWDLRLLDALPETEFTVMHVCRDRNMLAALYDYPVHAFNWDACAEGNPSLDEGKAVLGGKTVIGGIDHGEWLVRASSFDVAARTGDLRATIGDRGWMLGPGCTYAPETPQANVMAVRRAVGDGAAAL